MDRLQVLRGVIGPRVRADVSGQRLDLLLRVDQLIGQQVQGLARWRGQTGPVTRRDRALDIMNALRDDDAELAKMRARHAEGVLSARRVHDPGLPTDQKLPRVAPKAHLRCDVRHEPRLRALALHGDKPHRGA